MPPPSLWLLSRLTCSCFFTSAAAAAATGADANPPPPAPAPLTSTGVKAASPEAGDAVLWRVSVFGEVRERERAREEKKRKEPCQIFILGWNEKEEAECRLDVCFRLSFPLLLPN